MSCCRSSAADRSDAVIADRLAATIADHIATSPAATRVISRHPLPTIGPAAGGVCRATIAAIKWGMCETAAR